MPRAVDPVNVFRAPEHMPAAVDACLRIQCPAIWLQERLVNEPAAPAARKTGLAVIIDRCIYKDDVDLMT